MRNEKIIALGMLLLVVCLISFVYAESSEGFITGWALGNPTFNAFYGEVGYSNGSSIDDGVEIIANTSKGISISGVVDARGYGYDPLFILENGDEGDEVTFYVGGVEVGKIDYEEYVIIEFNLEIDVCGNGVCDGAESCSSCPGDCGACPSDGNGGSPGGSYVPPVDCVENWTCSDWGNCINNYQTRVCNDSSDCGTNETRPGENRRCLSGTASQDSELPVPSLNEKRSYIWLYMLVGILILIFVFFLIVLLTRKKKKKIERVIRLKK